MEPLRKPLQGVWNIIRFNRHFYIIAVVAVAGLFITTRFLTDPYPLLVSIIAWLIIIATVGSLVVSLYVYDLSGLYELNWLNNLHVNENAAIVNINAGFDETSALLQHKYPNTALHVFDFYDPLKHTEVSIKRARAAYAPFADTRQISTGQIPLTDEFADVVFLIFAAHEIRDKAERNQFFNELNRVLKPDGKVVLVEHLRDVNNFVAYNLGFFHFMPKSAWLNTFINTGFSIDHEMKFTPFITYFVLGKNGNTN